MAGIIRGFLGGGAKGAAQVGLMYLQEDIRRERGEADALRNSAITEGKQQFQTEEREAGQIFKAEESVKERKSREDIAAARGEKKPTYKTLTDEYGEDKLVQVNPDGSYTEIKEAGAMPEMKDVEPTTGDIQAAIKKYDETASWTKSDESQFGMSEAKFKKKYAQELAFERKKKEASPAKGGLIAGQMGRPAVSKKAPQRALDYLKANPDKLPEFMEKFGYDPTK